MLMCPSIACVGLRHSVAVRVKSLPTIVHEYGRLLLRGVWCSDNNFIRQLMPESDAIGARFATSSMSSGPHSGLSRSLPAAAWA